MRRLILFPSAALCAFLGAAILEFPRILTHEINRQLSKIQGHQAGIDRASFNPFKGVLTLDGFRLNKDQRAAPAAFLSADTLQMDLSWKALLHGRLVLDVRLDKFQGLFLMRQRRPDWPRKYGIWQKAFAGLPPFRIDRLTMVDGAIHLRNDEDIPPTYIFFDRIYAQASNMANRESLLQPRNAVAQGRGRMMGAAPLRLSIAVEPFRKHSTFQMTGRVTRFDLTLLNPVLRHYTGVDLERGSLTVEGDLEAREGSFRGSVRRAMKDLDVAGKKERHLGLITAAKEFVFESWLRRRRDKETGRLEAGYELSGPLGYMDKDIFLAAVWAAKSAFLQSLRPTLPEGVRMGAPEQAEEEWMALQAREREKLRRKTVKP